MKVWKRFASTTSFLILFIFTGLAFHEIGHAWVANFFGGSPSISYVFGFGLPIEGYTTYTDMDPRYFRIADFAGGIYSAAMLSGFYFWAKLSKTVHDTNLEFAAGSTALWQLFYGLGEGFLNDSVLLIQLIGVAGFLLGIVLFGRALWKWFSLPNVV